VQNKSEDLLDLEMMCDQLLQQSVEEVFSLPQQFLVDWDTEKKKLSKALNNGSQANILHLLHRLKGKAGMCMLNALRIEFAEIEDAVKSGKTQIDIDRISQLVHQSKQEYEKMKTELLA